MNNSEHPGPEHPGPLLGQSIAGQKAALRKSLREARRAHAASLPPEIRALVFARPPAPILALIRPGASIGLYRADPGEAPASAYARHFLEAGHTIALPRITARDAPMCFHVHKDPFAETDLEPGPMGLMQPGAGAEEIVPEVVLTPLVGFTGRGERIGQGGGFYDRWLAAHPATIAIGLAWDIQKVDHLPLEAHDMPLAAIITPTTIYGPF